MRSEHDRIRDEWEAVAGGWRRWEPLFQSFTWPVALRMVAVAQIGAGQRVLDVGCGIGDPTLQVAVLVGPHGHVLGIDLVEEMLATGRERAAALGLAHVEFRAADIATLDVPRRASMRCWHAGASSTWRMCPRRSDGFAGRCMTAAGSP